MRSNEIKLCCLAQPLSSPPILINLMHLPVCWSLPSTSFLQKLPCEQYFLSFWICKTIVSSACLHIRYLRVAYLLKFTSKPKSMLVVICSPWWVCAGANICHLMCMSQLRAHRASPSGLSFHHAAYLAPFYFLFLLVSSVF